ncbi:hypothetical protein JL722_13153 [Aureococcus anophagefferens]|nr:hypothetical protein JL722_13153 [Aureococcus anophagefferens]
MGKGGKGQPAHSRAFSAHATGAAIFRVYDTAQSGQLTYEQFANVFRLMSAPERTDELRLLERKVFLEKMVPNLGATLGTGASVAPHGANPLAPKFAAEPTHFALENPGFNAVCCATCVSELCWAPRANAATTVRLTPNAVVSVTEPYAGWSACMGPPIVAPCNCCLVCMGGDPMCTAYKNDRQVVDVVPLEFVDAVDVLRPVYPGGLERLVVSAYGGSHMIAKDGATNAKAVADAVMQQKASAARLDFNERAALQNFLVVLVPPDLSATAGPRTSARGASSATSARPCSR